MMKAIVRIATGLVASLLLVVAMASCSAEPRATDLEFGYKTFNANEGSDNGYISVYLMGTPYKYPVVIDIEVEMATGKDNNGRELTLDEVVKFKVEDVEYTVTKTGDRTAKIENVEVTYKNYNRRIYFEALDNDFLQGEKVTINFRLTRVDGSEVGSIKETTLTIVDDEKAPLLSVGYYKTNYDAPAEALSPSKGGFYLRLQKVGKYDYIASGWWGLERPRLLGKFDPEECTLSFDGTDYDHILWELKEPINAFRNDTIWAYSFTNNSGVKQILRMRGAGDSGLEPIVLSTEQIEENAKGLVVSIDTPCGMDIYNFNPLTGEVGDFAGIYDAMERSNSMTFSTTNYEEEGTRGTIDTPRPFGNWSINN